MMTVKRLSEATVLEYTEINTGSIIGAGRKTQNSVTYAVVDETGSVIKDSRGKYEIYTRKVTAQKSADWYNRKAS